ncbi:hypothetical protein F4604DRAFT_1920011 [Suillus subluteus]|nr:hypothetical protein F4604DRAFT_1920011 [Suillus subluteus]
MAPHLSPQLRERIVAWRYEHGKSAREIAELADCSERTIYDILRLHRDFGQTSNPFARQNARPRSLELDDIHYIYSILEANPGLYIDEIQQQLHSTTSSIVMNANLNKLQSITAGQIVCRVSAIGHCMQG